MPYDEDDILAELEYREATLIVSVNGNSYTKRLPVESASGYLGSGLYLDCLGRSYRFTDTGYDAYGDPVARMNLSLLDEVAFAVGTELISSGWDDGLTLGE